MSTTIKLKDKEYAFDKPLTLKEAIFVEGKLGKSLALFWREVQEVKDEAKNIRDLLFSMVSLKDPEITKEWIEESIDFESGKEMADKLVGFLLSSTPQENQTTSA